MWRRHRGGISEVVASIILASITVSLGLLIWGLVTGWSFIASLDFTRETDESISQMQALLSVEYAYVDGSGTCHLYLRNAGETNVTIVQILVHPGTGTPYDGIPPTTSSNVPDRTIRVGEVLLMDVDGVCSGGEEGVILEIKYLATRLLRTSGGYDDPFNHADRFVSLKYLLAC